MPVVNAPTKRLLIVYHSMTGGTLQMAQAAQAGASEEGVRAELKHASATLAQDVLAADGFIFATPENLAAMSGQMKDFFDRTYYPALEQLNGRPYLVLVCAGSDGRSAVQQIERIALGWRLKPVADPLIVMTHATTPEQILAAKRIDPDSLARCAELGRMLASGLDLGIF